MNDFFLDFFIFKQAPLLPPFCLGRPWAIKYGLCRKGEWNVTKMLWYTKPSSGVNPRPWDGRRPWRRSDDRRRIRLRREQYVPKLLWRPQNTTSAEGRNITLSLIPWSRFEKEWGLFTPVWAFYSSKKKIRTYWHYAQFRKEIQLQTILVSSMDRWSHTKNGVRAFYPRMSFLHL